MTSASAANKNATPGGGILFADFPTADRTAATLSCDHMLLAMREATTGPSRRPLSAATQAPCDSLITVPRIRRHRPGGLGEGLTPRLPVPEPGDSISILSSERRLVFH